VVQIHPDPPFSCDALLQPGSGADARITVLRLASHEKASRMRPGRKMRGAIAQLGERLLCKQEVGGSIPPGSTRLCGYAGG